MKTNNIAWAFLVTCIFAFIVIGSTNAKWSFGSAQNIPIVIDTVPGALFRISSDKLTHEWLEDSTVKYSPIVFCDSMGNCDRIVWYKDSLYIVGDTMRLINKWAKFSAEDMKRRWKEYDIGVVIINDGDILRAHYGDTVRVTKYDTRIQLAAK